MNKKSIKVLVVDDNESFRKGFVELLNKQNKLEVIGEAKDGLEALNLTHLLKPDLIMVDVSMPAIDGITFAKLIKEQTPEKLIVIVTIHEEAIFKILSDSLPADGFICKSSLSNDLPKVLNDLFPGAMPKIKRKVQPHLSGMK